MHVKAARSCLMQTQEVIIKRPRAAVEGWPMARFAFLHSCNRNGLACMVVIVLALVLAGSPAFAKEAAGGRFDSPAADRGTAIAADIQMVDAFLTVFTGGATGLPGMSELQQTQIASALLEGNVIEATRHARDYLTTQAINRFAGSSAAAFLTAVELGQTLGRATHEWMGEARLQAEFDRLGGLTGLAAWPHSYRAAMDEGFLGPVLDTRIRPVALWLRDLDGGTDAPMSVAYYENRAYHLMVAMRDLELGYRRFGLEGADRTPEGLAAALDAELTRAAAEALGQREALIWMNEVMRAEFARRESEREAAAARAEAQAAADSDAAKAAAAALRVQESALAAATEAESAARAALEVALAAQSDATLLPPLPDPQSGMVSVDLIRTEVLGPDMTAFHIRITNTGPAPIPAFRADLSAQRLPPGSGVAWGSDAPQPMLATGQVLEMMLVGTGDIGAVILHLAAMGETVATGVYPVAHSAPPPPAPPAPTAGLIELPAAFRGNSLSQVTLSTSGLSLGGEVRCSSQLDIDHGGRMTLANRCSGMHPVVGTVDPESGQVTSLTLYPFPETTNSHSGTVPVVEGLVEPARLGTALREMFQGIFSVEALELNVETTADRVTLTSRHVVESTSGLPMRITAHATTDLWLAR